LPSVVSATIGQRRYAIDHPIKLAGELAMLDNISDGRLDVGFGRAFIPEEYAAYGLDMQNSRAMFDEGIAAIKRLWTEERVVRYSRPVRRCCRRASVPRPFEPVATELLVFEIVILPPACQRTARGSAPTDALRVRP
jgi:alkanesulfonate monooxygenase SsuD/methylene tetrahydromethanopterin reductase-like flavin-dependent oxidoreductase (luciferase family)